MAGGSPGDSKNAARIEFPCHRCKKPVLASFEHVGRRGRCPHCDALVIVPFVRLPSGVSKEQPPAPPGAHVDEDAKVVEPKQDERRNFLRFAVEDCTLRLARAGGHMSRHSYPVKDMSRGGLAFLIGATPGLGAGLQPGEPVSLSVDVQAFGEPMDVSALVKRVKKADENSYIVGVELTDVRPVDADRIGRLEESQELRKRTRASQG